ncbi:hypothetical protein HMPREF0083_02980 [Aneurinibacillus aneurinilyticus ATCC 12856]|uniref:Uncharacterized protein n=1 Tax=Aneurinibacillus aneurinilyticus ATCC 12856 TaxID=649747 RepID=U1X319_ANEAE|nr:hypothetical protein HMPREF0083_02980 [Aneurinibacillus aneurinilyticus ATCC 12856]
MNCSKCNKEIPPSIKKGAPLKGVNHVAITYKYISLHLRN